MIGLGAVPSTNAYVPSAQPQLAGLYRDIQQRTAIPETKNTQPGKSPREASDRYDKDQSTAGLGFGGVKARGGSRSSTVCLRQACMTRS